jgi:hypothetical protein
VATGEPESVVWELNSLSSIGGNSVTVKGTPKVVETEIGQAVQFSRSPDQLLVNNNPLGTATEWTIETIVKPYDIGSESDLKEPRYLHVQDPADDTRRITMEMRVTSNKMWYFDAFIVNGSSNCTLIDKDLTHPVDKWYNVTITYGNGTFTTYVNGVKELTGSVTYGPISSNGIVSLGSRMNRRNYFNGAIRKVIVTKTILTPEQLDKSYLGTSTIYTAMVQAAPVMNKTVNPIVLIDNELIISSKVFTLTGRATNAEIHPSSVSNGVMIRLNAK